MLKRGLVVVFLLTILAGWSSVEAQIVKDGLVGYWSLDKSAVEGKKVKDLVGANDGEIKGDPKSVGGKLGEALEFDGVDDHVVIPNNDALNFGTGDFTVCVWVKTTAVTGRWAQRHDIVGKGDPSISGYAISADSNKGFFWVGGAGEFSGTTEINDGEWHYIVGVRKSSECFIYVDGKQEGKGTNSENVDTALNLIFAKHPLKNESYFKGSIDEVAIYNRALSEDEILKNYEAKAAAVEPSGKLAVTWGEVKSR
jgi:hypothetical protein